MKKAADPGCCQRQKWLPGALLPETGRFCRRILPENDTTARETCRINLPERKIPYREQRKPESGLFDTMESRIDNQNLILLKINNVLYGNRAIF